MERQLPKVYEKGFGMDKNYLEYRKQLWEKFANKMVKIVPSETGFNSFKELEKYNGKKGKVYEIHFTVNGRAAHIYITNCPLPLDEKFLEIVKP